MTAFLFPGQGAQAPGMGADLYEAHPEARALFDEADAVLGFALTDVMFGDDAEALVPTEVTQPALYAHSLAANAVLAARGLRPALAAGHSLGEWSALAAVGALSFADGLRAVRRRGELMAQAGDVRPGAMSAVLGLDDDALEAACREASGGGAGEVVPANYNSPGQIVISGDEAAVERAGRLAEEAGARRVVPLTVSGAFHSPLMAFARDGLAETLEALEISEPSCPVVLNVTAEPTTDPDEIRRRLLEQLTSPVRWAQSVQRMADEGATRFVEVGTGRVLSGLVKKTLGRGAETVQVGTAADLESLA
ncbi:ACP S-malonyltransferase [Rubrivirga sp. S365]|uniref:Malonyl CoA-acyl carrier protein transacylase n=1 Tax=Rubrivirga litoralis TaxID=3075598 RepID=A0ABU3BP53_9BACT|nr:MULTISPECIES: ACP S-malonyltransferase [unclassified Rubrivirga]MDT0631079.1 ACP S-malonyltransferase [Rubrivirga sp. F394]MDT7855409.1 ACP S-malonyltransferase [Rubrivirga sp. S365]